MKQIVDFLSACNEGPRWMTTMRQLQSTECH